MWFVIHHFKFIGKLRVNFNMWQEWNQTANFRIAKQQLFHTDSQSPQVKR